MHADNLKALLFAQLDACEDATTLRTLVKIADEVIEHQGNELDATREVLYILHAQAVESDIDADRYRLLKLILPSMLEVAAFTGAQAGDKAVNLFSILDPMKLDEVLDAQLAAGALEELEAKIEEQALAAQAEDDQQSAYGAPFREECLPQGVLSDEY
jgi:hypothetical protein